MRLEVDNEAGTIISSRNSQDFETKKAESDSFTLLQISQWSSNYEFLLMSIACKSEPPHYDYFIQRIPHQAPNIFQVLICYILVGIPVSYMQIILGQYTQRGLFFLRYMLPILRGVSFLSVIGMFWGWVVMVLMVEQYFLYILLACDRLPFMWLECYPPYDKICYQILKPCNVTPCLDENKFLAAYVYWNVTFMGGVPSHGQMKIAAPELSRAWALALAWIIIYLITCTTIDKSKWIIKSIVYLYLVCNILLLFELVSFSFDASVRTLCAVHAESFLSFESWQRALGRMSFDLNLGDSTYIMLGVYTSTKSQTGVLASVNGMVIYTLCFMKSLIISAAIILLIQKSGITVDDKYLLFQPTLSNYDVGVVPTVLGVVGAARAWTILYFLWLSLGVIVNVVVEMQLIHISIYTHYQKLIGYRFYITPIICFLGFLCGLIFESKESYEIYQEVLIRLKELCSSTNSFIMVVAVFYIYGMSRFQDDVHFMFGQAPTIFWRITWVFSPVSLIFGIPILFDRSLFQDYHAILAMAFLFLPIIIMTSYDIFRTVINKNIWSMFEPHKNWGPADTQKRELRRIFNPRHQTRYIMKNYALPCKHNCLLRNKVLNRILQEEEGTNRALRFVQERVNSIS